MENIIDFLEKLVFLVFGDISYETGEAAFQ